jgi:hypothetical protein
MAIVAWKEKAERARAALARFRKASESAAIHVRHDGEAIVAGAVAGAIRGSFEASGKDYSIPGPNNAKIPPELLMGGLLLAIGFSGQTDVSDDFHAAGSGVLAYSAGREAEAFMRLKGSKPPGTVQ